MAKDWPYALYTKTASEFGGPEAFLEKLQADAYKRGGKAMTLKMLPLLAVSAVAGAAVPKLIRKAQQIATQRRERKALAAQTETALTEDACETETPVDMCESSE